MPTVSAASDIARAHGVAVRVLDLAVDEDFEDLGELRTDLSALVVALW